MYSPEQTKNLQKKTQEFLKASAQPAFADLPLLREILKFHEYRYYILNDPLVADFEYDQLYKKLERAEAENPGAIPPDSPTQRVGKGLTRDFPTVKHLVPMLSLENSYNAEDLIDWDRKARELSKENVLEYCVEPKFDGAGISLIYENDLLIRGATRGDGVEGEDITTNIKQIRSVPLSAPFSRYGIETIEIRGEIIMTKQAFKKYNDLLMEEGLPALANPRNAASGSLRIKDPRIVAKRKLEAFLYHISYYTKKPETELDPGHLLATHSGALRMLWDCGFRSPQKEKQVLQGINEIIRHVHDFEEMRETLPYEIDGMVIKVNDFSLQEKLGMTTHHPRWAIAFKFKARQATTILRSVEFNVGRTGAVTPVAKLDPVYIGGVNVSSISMHNEEYIREKDIKIGDSVLIERAGDVIPQIVKSLAELRDGTETTIRFPRHCPVCRSSLYKEPDEAVWRCQNIDCPAQVVERIIHFVSKDAMDIKSFGEANVRKFYELQLLKDIPGIYTLDFQKIAALEGFKEKSVNNLKNAIEASKNQPLYRLIYGLGIRFVGETTAKTLAGTVDNIFDFQHKSVEELQEIEDVGTKVAQSIFHFFHTDSNIGLLRSLKDLGLKLDNEKKISPDKNNRLHNQTFLFTGTLSRLKRSEAENMVEANGGKIVSGVSSKLDYLVMGEDAGSKLEKARKIHTIRIISEDEFLNLLKEA